MLALIFWNARRTDVDKSRYREALFAFHAELNRVKPAGLRYSCTFMSPPLPWFAPTNEVYEDWYVLRNFAGVDALDEAVAERDTMQSHRYLMRNTAGASAAIVGLAGGQAKICDYTEAYWTSTPRGITSAEFVSRAANQSRMARTSVWTRSLALGPREQLVLAKAPISEGFLNDAIHLKRQLMWRPS